MHKATPGGYLKFLHPWPPGGQQRSLRTECLRENKADTIREGGLP
jgi:hypothetical protein